MTDIDVDALAPCDDAGLVERLNALADWLGHDDPRESRSMHVLRAEASAGDVRNAAAQVAALNAMIPHLRAQSTSTQQLVDIQSAPAPDDVREAVAKGLYNHEWSRDGNGMGKIWGENTDRLYWLALADAAIAAMRGREA